MLLLDRDLVKEWRREQCGPSNRVVLTTGCFDLLHVGHLELLKWCRQQGNILIVGVNSDASVRRLKGDSRPFMREFARLRIVNAVNGVDLVTLFYEDTPEELIRTVRPHVYVKGGDYGSLETLPEASVVTSQGGEVRLAPFLPGYSSTRLARRVAAQMRPEMEEEERCGGY